jgi:small subunit ribosomal protein S20
VANIKSQKKRIKTNAKRAERNKAVRSELKTRVKTATRDAGTDDAIAAARLAQKRLDKAAAKGVIHKNQAARRKSRMMKAVNVVAS